LKKIWCGRTDKKFVCCKLPNYNNYLYKGGLAMADVNAPKSRKQHVWVKDKAGNEYICPIEALKDPKKATDQELKNCVDDASVPQAGAGG